MIAAIRLSKSQIDKYQDCARCFWLKQRHKFDQPEMISSKVWKGIERITTAHYESHRLAKTTPMNLVGQVPAGAIPYQADRIDMKSLRYWGKGLAFVVDGVTVTTALDDMLERPPKGAMPKVYNVIDYKSKSKATDAEATADLYENQADVFDLAANVNGYPTDGVVYFDYWYPIAVHGEEETNPKLEGDHGKTHQVWGSQVVALKADHARCKKLVLAAAACLDSALPEPPTNAKGNISCAVCAYVADRAELIRDMDPTNPLKAAA